jgi:hypothetical protein
LDYQARNNYGGLLLDAAASAEERSRAMQELLKASSEAPPHDEIVENNLKGLKTAEPGMMEARGHERIRGKHPAPRLTGSRSAAQ